MGNLDRDYGLGGHDCAAACGISKWRTPYQLWAEKTGRVTREDISTKPAVEWGRRLEGAVVRKYIDATGHAYVESETLRDPELPWMRGTPDGFVTAPGGQVRGLEVKTASGRSARWWGPSGTDEVPVDYAMQCAHYALITKVTTWDVAVLLDQSDYRTYTLAFPPAMLTAVAGHLRAMWDRIITDTAPDAFPEDADLAYPRSSDGTCVDAGDNLRELLSELRSCRNTARALRARESELIGKVKLAAKDSESIKCDGVTVATLRWQERNTLDSARLKSDYPDIYKAYLKTSRSRPLSLKATGNTSENM